jgi:hypothetical protein
VPTSVEPRLADLRHAWADIWPPALLVLGILLVSRSGALAVTGRSTAPLLWPRGDTRYQDLAHYFWGFLVFVTLRRLPGNFAPPAQVGYPMAIDRVPFGEVPAVWLLGHRPSLW